MHNVFTEITPWQLILLGGPVMWVVLFCSIFSLAVMAERFRYFAAINIDAARLKARVFEAIRHNNIKSAVLECEKVNAPVARMVKAGILKIGADRVDVLAAMEEVAHVEIPVMEQRVQTLALIGHIAPLLGLLGTVAGLSGLFQTIQIRAAALNPVMPADVASGVWAALMATAAGCLVAVPAYVAHHYFVRCVTIHVVGMEQTAIDLAQVCSRFSAGESDGKV